MLTFRWKFTLWAKIYDFYALSLWLWSRINWMEFLIFTANGLSRKNVKKLAETSIWQTPRKLKLHGWSSYNTVSNEALLSENEDYLLQFHSSKCHYKILFLATDNEIVKNMNDVTSELFPLETWIKRRYWISAIMIYMFMQAPNHQKRLVFQNKMTCAFWHEYESFFESMLFWIIESM